MKFGLNFFPSFRSSDTTTAEYFDQCLRLSERADELGFDSVKTVEQINFGGIRDKEAFRTLELFASHVMPAFARG